MNLREWFRRRIYRDRYDANMDAIIDYLRGAGHTAAARDLAELHKLNQSLKNREGRWRGGR